MRCEVRLKKFINCRSGWLVGFSSSQETNLRNMASATDPKLLFISLKLSY